MRTRKDRAYDLLVPVEWDVDADPVLATMNKYFWKYSRKPFILEKVNFSGHMCGSTWA